VEAEIAGSAWPTLNTLYRFELRKTRLDEMANLRGPRELRLRADGAFK
jgi:hypothetical protein